MNELDIFNNPEFGELRTVEIGGEPWFVGKDVAVSLGYGEGKSLANAVASHVDDEDKGVTELMTPGGRQKFVIINESGLYSLVLSSKLPTAKKFKRWVTSEVLPSIRKNGAYSLNMSRELRAVIVVDQRVTKVQEETNALRQDFEVFKQDMPILGVEETKITEAVKRNQAETAVNVINSYCVPLALKEQVDSCNAQMEM